MARAFANAGMFARTPLLGLSAADAGVRTAVKQHRADQLRRPQRPAGGLIPDNFETVRAIACLLLVAYHVVGSTATRGLRLPMDSPWHWAVESFAFVRMPLFTILSGYIYAARRASLAALRPIWRKRLRRIGIPLLVCTLVTFTLRTEFRDESRTLLSALTSSYEHLWFLQAILVVFGFVTLWDALARPSPRALAAACAFAAVACAAGSVTTSFFSLGGACYLLPFFLFGMVVRETPVLLGDKRIAIAAAIGVGIVLADQQAGFAGLTDAPLKTGLPGLLCGMGAALILLRLVPRIGSLERIGSHSYTIYLWHAAALSGARWLAIHGGISDIAVLFTFSMAAGITVPLLFHAAISQQHPAIAIALTGTARRDTRSRKDRDGWRE